MEVVIGKQELGKMLARAAAVAGQKSPIIALKCVLLEAAGDGLTASATDLYLSTTERSSCTVKSPGKVAVDARKVAEIVRAMPSGDVTLRVVKGHLELRAGKAARFKVPEMPADDFPTLPSPERAKPVARIEAKELARCLAQGGYAAAGDDSRPGMEACAIEAGDGLLRFASTDGKRLAYAESVSPEAAKVLMLVPARGVSELKRMCDGSADIELSTDGPFIFAHVGEVRLSVKLVEAAYPPYARLFPVRERRGLDVPREALVQVVKRVSLCAGGKDGGGVLLRCEPGLVRVSAVSQDSDEAEDVVECACDVEAAVCLNPAYLVQALEAADGDDVHVDLDGELDVVVLGRAGDRTRSLVMPRRLAS